MVAIFEIDYASFKGLQKKRLRPPESRRNPFAHHKSSSRGAAILSANRANVIPFCGPHRGVPEVSAARQELMRRELGPFGDKKEENAIIRFMRICSALKANFP